jgi:polysaccharide biosynthesis/export protein
MTYSHRPVSCAVFLFIISCAGCSSFIPESGPKLSDIMGSAEIRVQNVPNPTRGFALIRVDEPIAEKLSHQDPPLQFALSDLDQPRSAISVGVGDVMQVTIFETGSGGLFIPADAGSRPGNFVQLPPQQVGQNGLITVPWAGKIRAEGRTPITIQTDIEKKLANRALEPQVVVSFIERHANEVSVLGDVGAATRFSMDASGERILGAIARAGGPRFPDYESIVTLQRHGRATSAMLSEIADNPQQNIAMEPGDYVYVAHQPRYFLAVGATGQSTTLSQLDRRFPFGDKTIDLADALAEAGGVEDDRANARAVFLYRYETHAALERFGLNVPPSLPAKVPTIYAIDLADPSGFFLCNRIAMRNGDTIYVANAPSTDLTKVLNVLLPLAESASAINSATH